MRNREAIANRFSEGATFALREMSRRIPSPEAGFDARVDTCAIMTLLLLLLYPSDSWYVRVPTAVLCVAAFIFSSLRNNAVFWFIVASMIMAGNYQTWFLIDNHKYLLGYWCFALFGALKASDARRNLASSARWLIALSFLFAFVWKLISSDYLDGSFFHYTLLIDERFVIVSTSLGGITGEMYELNHAAYNALTNYDSRLAAVPMTYPPGISRLAVIFTWWTLLIEMLIAAVFLWPEGGLLARWRDYLLILFILSTYALAPVLGFGWTLIIMGLAQCSDRSRLLPHLYLFAFIILQAYSFPWRTIFSQTLN